MTHGTDGKRRKNRHRPALFYGQTGDAADARFMATHPRETIAYPRALAHTHTHKEEQINIQIKSSQ